MHTRPHSRPVELDQVCRCTRNTPCIPFLRSAATLPCRPPNPDTISRLFSPPFPTFRRSLSLRPVGGRALIGLSLEMVVGGWLQLHARQEASGGGVEVEGVGIEDTFPSGLIAVRVHVCNCVG